MQVPEHYNYTMALDAEITWYQLFPLILWVHSVSLCETEKGRTYTE